MWHYNIRNAPVTLGYVLAAFAVIDVWNIKTVLEELFLWMTSMWR
jgi:hypothetical protein